MAFGLVGSIKARTRIKEHGKEGANIGSRCYNTPESQAERYPVTLLAHKNAVFVPGQLY